MAVRKCPTHDKCYIVDWRPQGRNGPHPQRHFPGTEAEATAFHQEMVRLARKARHVPVSFDPRVRDLLADWKEDYRNNHLPNTVRDLESCLVPLTRFFGTMHLSEICAPVVEQYKSQRHTTPIDAPQRKGESAAGYAKRRAATPPRTISKRTINKELAYFSGFLRWCHEHGHVDQLVRVKRFPAKHAQPKEPVRPLFPEEVEALLRHLEPQYHAPFLLMNDAGLRRSEALTITVDRVDLARRVLIIQGKGAKIRIVPITTDRLAAALAAALKATKKGFLFTNPQKKKPSDSPRPWYSIRKALLRAAEKAGIDRRVYHHLLRHTFGTIAMASQMNPRSVQEIMGHTSFQTTEIYIHLAGQYHQAEAAKFQQYLTETQDNTVSAKKTRKPAPRKTRQTQTKN